MKIIYLWLIGALCMFFYSTGLDQGCGRKSPSIENPLAFLVWPAGAIAILGGWEPEKKLNHCGDEE